MEEQRAKLFQNKRPHDKSGAERSYPIRGKPRGTERVARVLYSGENGTHTDTHRDKSTVYKPHTHKGKHFHTAACCVEAVPAIQLQATGEVMEHMKLATTLPLNMSRPSLCPCDCHSKSVYPLSCSFCSIITKNLFFKALDEIRNKASLGSILKNYSGSSSDWYLTLTPKP